MNLSIRAFFIFTCLLSLSQKAFSNAEEECIETYLIAIDGASDESAKLQLYNQGLSCYAKQGLNLRGHHADLAGEYCAKTNNGNYAAMFSCNSSIQNYDDNNPVIGKCFSCFPDSYTSIPNIRSCIQSNSSLNAATMSRFKAPPGSSCSSEQKQEDPPPKKEEPQPEPEGPPSAYDPQCKQQLDKMYSQCKEQTAPVAAQKCDPAKNEELMKNKQTALAALQMASMATGMNDPCSKISMAMDATGAGVAAFMRTCNEARVNCTNACQDVVDKIDDTKGCALKTPQNQNPDNKGLPEINEMSEIANRNIGACGEQGTYAKRESEAPQIMAQLMNAGSKAKACADATKGYGKNSLADPCMGPGAATNPMCIGMNGGGGPSPIGGGDTPGGFRAGGNDRSGLGVAAGDRGFEMPNGPSGPGLNMGDGSGAGGSGGGPKAGIGAGGMGSGLSSGSGGDESGAGGSTESKGMYSGYRSNGVGGAAGGGHGGGAAGNAGLPGGQQGKFGPDLNKYLPGGSFDPKRRGIAGATGPDGITGPHTNIWEKISNRYQATTESLLP